MSDDDIPDLEGLDDELFDAPWTANERGQTKLVEVRFYKSGPPRGDGKRGAPLIVWDAASPDLINELRGARRGTRRELGGQVLIYVDDELLPESAPSLDEEEMLVAEPRVAQTSAVTTQFLEAQVARYQREIEDLEASVRAARASAREERSQIRRELDEEIRELKALKKAELTELRERFEAEAGQYSAILLRQRETVTAHMARESELSEQIYSRETAVQLHATSLLQAAESERARIRELREQLVGADGESRSMADVVADLLSDPEKMASTVQVVAGLLEIVGKKA